jgi:hypothetical protein
LAQQNNNQAQPPSQNFGGFDFTNTSIPQNKERQDQQNRLNQLESALNNLNMNPQQNQGMNMNMNNMMMQNNNMNFMNINNMGMNNNNNSNNIKDPFADISLNNNSKGNYMNNFNNQQQPQNDNNPFSFI